LLSRSQGGAYNRDAPSLAKTIVPYLSFRQQLRNPAGDMPAYAATVMSEKDLADIYAFLQALPGRRDVKDFTILNDRGSCVGNHIGRLRLPSRRCMPKSIGSASPAAIWT